MNGNNFQSLNDNDLAMVNGGGITVGTAILIGCGVTMGLSAVVSFFNGYSDAAGK